MKISEINSNIVNSSQINTFHKTIVNSLIGKGEEQKESNNLKEKIQAYANPNLKDYGIC